ncbi:energy transducer TonB [Flavobacterium amniphilum]|uniref:energy transducer TonB n=1 Tax=Flavobacterium amniphilum TaxID=1834035 RepID=UPI00202A214E|nr:energy transducer TonB [Flavobacterium amniphilum]MCL9806703.1 energy transducer TonB [Flavobacterium amniphilum]
MKLDLFRTQWLDLVFEGRNKKYGAYQLRKENPKTALRSLLLGGFVFAFAVSSPKLIELLPSGNNADNSIDEKVVLMNLDKPKENVPPPPPEKKPEPPKPKVDEVKFVKPKVVEAAKVTEEIKTMDELKDKNIAEKDQKGDENAKVSIDQPTGNSDKPAEVEDNTVYSTAGLEVQPEFPGGWGKFGQYVAQKYRVDEISERAGQDLKGRVIVEFVVEKDGSLTDIKVIRDLGYGTGDEAIRVLKSMPKLKPGEQNGKKVRARFSLPISVTITAE